MNGGEAKAVVIVFFITFVVGMVIGAFTANSLWTGIVTKSGRAHYVVDAQTGKTELVWTK